jgi:hypothetical protein
MVVKLDPSQISKGSPYFDLGQNKKIRHYKLSAQIK